MNGITAQSLPTLSSPSDSCGDTRGHRRTLLQGTQRQQRQPRFRASYSDCRRRNSLRATQRALCTNALHPDVAHQTLEAESVVEYAHTTTKLPGCSVGEKAGRIPNTLNEAIGLPEKERGKVASKKEIDSLRKNNVPATSVPTRNKLIGSRWLC